MTTLARHIISEPVRTASETWKIIVDLLASNSDSLARSELLSVVGVASSLIASEAAKDSPIVVYGSGPRIRIYCLYGEDAIVGDGGQIGTSFKSHVRRLDCIAPMSRR